MVEKIRKFYMNRILFIVVSALTVCCYGAAVICAVIENYSGSDFRWIMLGLAVLLQCAFFTGMINVQKVLFGAMLIAMIEVQIELLKLNIAYGAQLGIVLGIINLILAIVAFASHMIQQTDYKGKSLAVVLDQAMGLTALLFLISVITGLITSPAALGSNIFALGYFFNSIMIICMESRVATYKQLRDKARTEGVWVEEAKQAAKKMFKI